MGSSPTERIEECIMGKSRKDQPLRFVTSDGLMFVSDGIDLRSYDRNGRLVHMLTLNKEVCKKSASVFASLLKSHPRLFNIFPDWLKRAREVRSINLIHQIASPPSSVG